MPLMTITVDGETYNADVLFYGDWPLRQMTYQASFPLYYNDEVKWTWTPTEGNYGVFRINGKEVGTGTPPDGYGTAMPKITQATGDALGEVGAGLLRFQTKVLEWSAGELNKQWEGPAHDGMQRVLTGIDHWVGDALRVTHWASDPNGQGYENPTYDMATAHQNAQTEFQRVAGHYRYRWETLFWQHHDWLSRHLFDENFNFWFYEYISSTNSYRKTFDHAAFSRWLYGSFSEMYKNRIDIEIIDPAKKSFDDNQTRLDGIYQGLVAKYVDAPKQPWFEPAPPPKKEDTDTTINIEGFEPPKYEPPDYDPPTFDPPKFDPPNFDPPNVDQPNLDQSALDQPSLDGSGPPGLDQLNSAGPPSLNGSLGPDGQPLTGTGGLMPMGSGPGPTGEQGRGRGLVTGPDGRTGLDVTGDGKPDLGLDGRLLPGGGLPPGSRVVTGPDGTRGVDLDGDGIADVGLDGRTLPDGSLPPGARLVTGPDGQTGLDVTGDGVPDLGLDGKALPHGGLPPGSELVTGPDGTRGIDLDGDGVPDIGADGWALPGGSLPPGAHLVTGPDGTTGFDVTGDGIPDFGLGGEWLPDGTFFNHPDAPDVNSQIVRPPDDLRGSPGSLSPSGLPVAGGGSPMMPMMPMMGGMGGMGGGGGQNQNNDRERQTWLLEEEKVWKGERVEPTAVLGRPTDDDDEEPEHDEWEAPVKSGPTRGKPGQGRPGQRPPAGWPQGRANR